MVNDDYYLRGGSIDGKLPSESFSSSSPSSSSACEKGATVGGIGGSLLNLALIAERYRSDMADGRKGDVPGQVSTAH